MAYAELDRRVTKLETRTREVEESHDESIYRLRRDVTGLKVSMGRSFALLMQHAGVPADKIRMVTEATETEIDAALEQNC